MKRPLLAAVIWLIVALALGVVIAVVANQTLEIQFGTKIIPDDGVGDLLPQLDRLSAASHGEPAAIARIALPADGGSELLLAAVGELADSVEELTGRRPAILESERGREADDRSLQISVEIEPTAEESGEGYVLSQNDVHHWVVSSHSGEGAARGVFRVADAVRSGWDETRLLSLFDGREVTPAFARRLVDLGGVAITPDAAAWRRDDYSHNTQAFAGMILSNPPYVDPEALAVYEAQMKTYLTRMASYGYNGAVFEGFLQFVDFDKLGSGYDVYPVDSAYRARHEALRQAYGRLFQLADSLGFDLYLYTDMLALSTPLEQFLEQQLGGVDAEDPRLWEVYRSGLDELFEQFPTLDGLMIRVGEAGAVYNRPGWEYWSTLDVRSQEAVQAMLRELSASAEEYGREILFRSWSVGLGEAGAMHTDPEVYQKVLGPLSMDNLVVSTKFVQGDFESFLPLNPTLTVGDQRRLIEFQARREYEGFSAFPNYLARAHQIALQAARSQDSTIEGLWVWTQMGGPLRAGTMSLYPFIGPWHSIDANVYATARLSWDPDQDLAQITIDWVRRTYEPRDEDAIKRLAEITLTSHDVAIQGIHLSDYSRRLVLATGRDAEAIGRLFQWDILSGSTSELGLAYRGLPNGSEPAVQEGFAAVERVRALLRKAESVAADQVEHPSTLTELQESLRYELSMFIVLAWYRETFLSHQRWLARGESADLTRWRAALDGFEDARAQHIATYGESVEFPPLNFFAADQGLAHARRSESMAWAARVWLIFTGTLLALGGVAGLVSRKAPGNVPAGVRDFFLGAFVPWRLSGAREGDRRVGPLLETLFIAAAFILVLSGVSIFSSFLSPSLLSLTVLLLLAFWTPVLVVYMRSSGKAWAVVAGPQLLVTGLVLVPVAVRGPLFFWQGVLLNQTFRTVFLLLFVLAALWPAFALYAFHRNSHRRLSALARVSVGVGAAIAVTAVSGFLIGTEEAVSRMNYELAVLPFALSRTLGLTIHVNVTDRLTIFVALAAAGTVVAAAALIWLLRRPQTPQREIRDEVLPKL